jgi:hypothetical protein
MLTKFLTDALDSIRFSIQTSGGFQRNEMLLRVEAIAA